MEVWINPACTKCRVARAELDAAGISYTERRYLEDVPSTAELAEVLDRMGLQPWDIARPRETKEAGITIPRDAAHREDWLAAMVADPRTIQRPIITADDGTAVVGRSADSVRSILPPG
jgi:arsenate reductase